MIWRMIAAGCILAASGANVAPGRAQDAGARLIQAYPEFLSHVENGQLIWKDGTRMPLSDGQAGKTAGQLLDDPDLDDMFAYSYPKGRAGEPPANDPGRVRYAPFLSKMYGDCLLGGTAKHLTRIAWLPRYGGGTVQVTRVNGVDKKLSAVSAELEMLPPDMVRDFLIPSSGGYKCRPIAGTQRPSAHGYGIAIDIATRQSDYWRWSPGGAYRNRVPPEIVGIFERHGFIWGGKWRRFDTMHFEYRPEMLID